MFQNVVYRTANGKVKVVVVTRIADSFGNREGGVGRWGQNLKFCLCKFLLSQTFSVSPTTHWSDELLGANYQFLHYQHSTDRLSANLRQISGNCVTSRGRKLKTVRITWNFQKMWRRHGISCDEEKYYNKINYLLSNSDEFLEFARPTTAKIVHVGGIALPEKEPLSEVSLNPFTW